MHSSEAEALDAFYTSASLCTGLAPNTGWKAAVQSFHPAKKDRGIDQIATEEEGEKRARKSGGREWKKAEVSQR